MQRTNDEQDRTEQYIKPEIADYGDLVEKTASGHTGEHLDLSLPAGAVATFLSSAP